MRKEARKYIVSTIKKYLGIFIPLVGVLLYILGAVRLWHSLAMTGLVIISFGFFVGLVQVSHVKFNPKVTILLNLFFPGLGFVYCRRWYFVLGGGLLFVVSLHPQFPFLTILSFIGTAITNLSALTPPVVILALGLNSLLAVLTYFAAKYVQQGGGA